jgi:serine/threonine-protein kinase
MLVGQQLGPFAIDKELGSGAMGAVYRGTYTKTGQRVAIKVMAPGLARDSAAERFEREAAILKQFNHPNIVRLFGVGRHHGTAYYAMEYIDGESLDRVLSRRGKLSWDEVVAFGMQLCAALQHSHEAGVIHRDLKPSNLMILKDGKTLKLTDFGIAKDSDATQLTSANCTVGTASYMSPEQCRGERDLTAKSDLYSLGVVFYELLTGKKPFEAENAMEIFIKHVNEVPNRPTHQPGCLDIPVWLDTLVCQLMEKKPHQRPLNAAMVYSVLESIRGKVEAQQSAGVDAAKKKLLDTPRDQRKIEDEDRDAARTLLGGKARLKKKRRMGRNFIGSVWFQIPAILAVLTGMGLALWVVFRPPAPEKLYAQAKKLMESNDPADWDKAADDHHGPIALYLKHHGDRPGKETEQMRAWQKQVDQSQCERLVAKYVSNRRGGGGVLKVQTQNEAEEAAFKAGWAEETGELADALRRWDEMKKKFESGSGLTRWGRFAEQRARVVERVLGQEKAWDKLDPQQSGEKQGLTGTEKDAFDLFREKAAVGKYKALKERLETDLKEAAPGKEGDERYWIMYAAYKVREMEKADDKPGRDAKTPRP